MYTNEDVGATSVLYCGNRGQRIAESRVFLGEDRQPRNELDTVRMHFLTREYPDSSEMRRFLDEMTEPKPAEDGTSTSQLETGAHAARASR